jgi:hypothetical protein
MTSRLVVILAGVLLAGGVRAQDAAKTAAAAGQGDLIAIDVLIEPGPKMLAEAARWNARMREQIPEGFALDEAHVPHITLIQCFVPRADLPKVLAAVDGVRTKLDVHRMQMTATGLFHILSGKHGLAGIVVEPSEQLLALQRAVIEAVNVYARPGGGGSAFVPDTSGTPWAPWLFEYVETFVPRQTGERFNPHVTTGVAPLDWLEDQEKKPFEKFTFDAKGLAAYQLGNFGTASRRLDRKQ